MNEDTAVIPAVQAAGHVYGNRYARLWRLWAKFRRELAAVIATKEMPSAVLRTKEGIRAWAAHLKAARAYGKTARHRRRMFVTDPVSGRIRRERYVTERTPIDQRVYAPVPTIPPRRQTTIHAMRGRVDVFNPVVWQEETTTIVRRMQATRRNSALVMSGVQGPLESEK